jgi:hypothetical protein
VPRATFLCSDISGIKGHMLKIFIIMMKSHQDIVLLRILVVIMLNIEDIKLPQGVTLPLSKTLIIICSSQQGTIKMI